MDTVQKYCSEVSEEFRESCRKNLGTFTKILVYIIIRKFWKIKKKILEIIEFLQQRQKVTRLYKNLYPSYMFMSVDSKFFFQ